MENSLLADWFFYHCIVKFMDVFYKGILKAKDYWLHFEYQHRGSPHVHGVAWLEDAPDVEEVLSSEDPSAHQELIQYINRTVTTINPAILPDGSNIADAPLPKTNPHICNKPYTDVEDHHQDLIDLIATCQRHTRCSAAYCLRTKNGVQQCHFGYPKQHQTETEIVQDEDNNPEPVLNLARNNGLINSCKLGEVMWTCNTVCPDTRWSSISPSMQPSVNLDCL